MYLSFAGARPTYPGMGRERAAEESFSEEPNFDHPRGRLPTQTEPRPQSGGWAPQPPYGSIDCGIIELLNSAPATGEQKE